MAENRYIPDLVALINYGSTLFSTSQRLALEFLYNRTVKFNKTSEAIPYSDWDAGIYSSEGKLITAPVGLTKRTIIDATRKLEEMGYITIREKRFGNTRINHFTIHVKKITEDLMQMALNLGKKYLARKEEKDSIRNKKVVQSSTSGGCKVAPVPSADEHQPLKNTIQRADNSKSRNEIESGDSLPSPKRQELEDQLEEVRIKNIATLQRKVDRMDSTPTYPGITSAWKLSCMEHYKGRTITHDFKKESFFKLKAGIQSHQLPDSIGIVQFIDWVIENWAVLPSCELSWVRGRFPSLPSFAYFSAMYKHFLNAYGELDEKGVINGHKLSIATSHTQAQNRVDRELLRIERLTAENQQLKEKEQHLSRLIREERPIRSRRKLNMKPVDELDFDSIAPLPAI